MLTSVSIEQAAAAIAVVTGLPVAFRYTVLPIWKGYKSRKKTWEHLEKLLPVLTEATKQLFPNGGKSLADSITRIENQLYEYRERSRAMLAYAPDAFFEADARGTFTWVNHTWCDLVGMEMSQAVGHGWVNTIPETDRNRVVSAWMDAVKYEREFMMQYELQNLRTDELTMCKVHAFVIRGKRGEVIGYIGHVTQLDERG